MKEKEKAQVSTSAFFFIWAVFSGVCSFLFLIVLGCFFLVFGRFGMVFGSSFSVSLRWFFAHCLWRCGYCSLHSVFLLFDHYYFTALACGVVRTADLSPVCDDFFSGSLTPYNPKTAHIYDPIKFVVDNCINAVKPRLQINQCYSSVNRTIRTQT